jgi:N-acetylneuraminic acid mutarotase
MDRAPKLSQLEKGFDDELEWYDKHELQERSMRRRIPGLIVLASLVMGLTLPQHVDATPAVNGCWYYRSDMPTLLRARAAVALNGEIYVIGGIDAQENRVGAVDVYEPNTDSWSSAAPLNTPRGWLVAAAVGGRIYAIGGNNGSTKLGTVEAYNPATNTWVELAPMPTPRDDAAVGVWDGKIYVIGGWDNGNVGALDIVEVYDPVTDTWDTGYEAMPGPLAMASSAVIGNEIYVIGGLDGVSGDTSHNYVYNARRDRWGVAADMPTPRSRSAAGVVNGRIYVIGGRSSSLGWLDLVERYDPFTEAWATMNWMPTRRGEIAAAVANDKGKDLIYVFGGVRSWDSAVVGNTDAVDFACQNNPPDVPSEPNPPWEWTNRPRDTVLSWSADDPDGHTVFYDVYFGPSATPRQSTTPPLVSSGQGGTAYVPPGLLAPDTYYYWRIVAIDSQGAVTAGPRWDFETGQLETVKSLVYLPFVQRNHATVASVVEPTRVTRGDLPTAVREAVSVMLSTLTVGFAGGASH